MHWLIKILWSGQNEHNKPVHLKPAAWYLTNPTIDIPCQGVGATPPSQCNSWPWTQPSVTLLNHSKRENPPVSDLTTLTTALKSAENITTTCSWPLRACQWLLMLSTENCPGRSSSSVLVCPGLSTHSNFCFKATEAVEQHLVFKAYTWVKPSRLFAHFLKMFSYCITSVLHQHI